jgi:hypothetical protein
LPTLLIQRSEWNQTMEELIELRSYIEQQRYADALVLIGEMEE